VISEHIFWSHLYSSSLFTSGLDALFDVQKELYQVTAKWQSIGIALRLDPNILNCIQARNNAEPQACLSSVLTEWLKRNYNVKRFGEPTWQWLVDAVGDPAGGAHMALARDIARRYSMSECLCTISSAKGVCHRSSMVSTK